MAARRLLDAGRVKQAVEDLVGRIRENHPETQRLAVVGIRKRGVPLAARLAARLEEETGLAPARGSLDITLYRDDLGAIGHQPVVRGTELAFNPEGKDVILVDDVLFTGRTVRAALDEIIDFGRPRCIRLAVLVDRGHRELPIAADYVGLAVQTKRDEMVNVYLQETDGRDEVVAVPGP